MQNTLPENTDVVGHDITYGRTKIAKGAGSTGMLFRTKRKQPRRKTVNPTKLALLHMTRVLSGKGGVSVKNAAKVTDENVTERQLASAQKIVDTQVERLNKRLETISEREQKRAAAAGGKTADEPIDEKDTRKKGKKGKKGKKAKK